MALDLLGTAATVRTVMSLAWMLGMISCGPASSFPPDVEPDAWTEARYPSCTLSHDHDLTFIRVFANDSALEPYTTFDAPYPEGAALLKGLYRDEECSELVGFVTMEKLTLGSSPDTMDWDWRRFDEAGAEVVNPRQIPSRCVDCHAWHCGELPYGWDMTCSREGIEPPGPPPI